MRRQLFHLSSGCLKIVSIGIVLLGILVGSAVGEAAARSHPPLHKAAPAFNRLPAKGPAYYVDAKIGDDENEGSKASPWRTVNHALRGLRAGDTLYLRAGTFHENVYLSLAGRKDAPITIRSFPGERATIDGGFREFFDDSQSAWEPFPKGSSGEYRSKKTYGNLRNIHGRFGDSMVGLQVYYHIEDLRGERYVGPGIWYDRSTGRIHIRIQHYEKQGVKRGRIKTTLTYLPARLHQFESYQGETDPRKLPLIIAPFHSIPLRLDRPRHVKIQDLVIRGGGFDVVDIRHGEHLEMDNVTIYAAAYGLKARNTGPFKLTNSAIRGSVPPWSTRAESSLRERPWKSKGRNLTRLNTHALLLATAGDEFSVYYFPYNHLWEISNCEFSDAHDGLYLGDLDGLKFHHNYLHNFQDDGIYLSAFRKVYYPQHGPRLFYQNVINGCLMAFAYGGDGKLSTEAHVYRNILDGYFVVADHGGPPWDGMRWYHNTFLASTPFVFRIRVKPGQTWQVFNNLCLNPGAPLTKLAPPAKLNEGSAVGGNFRGAAKFMKLGEFHLKPGSPAVNAGMPIPADWPDPLREFDKGKPDVGAVPLGAGPLKVGRFGRFSF